MPSGVKILLGILKEEDNIKFGASQVYTQNNLVKDPVLSSSQNLYLTIFLFSEVVI